MKKLMCLSLALLGAMVSSSTRSSVTEPVCPETLSALDDSVIVERWVCDGNDEYLGCRHFCDICKTPLIGTPPYEDGYIVYNGYPTSYAYTCPECGYYNHN